MESYRRETEECINGYLRNMQDLTKKINECLLNVHRSEEKCGTGRLNSSQLDQILDKLFNELIPPINSKFKNFGFTKMNRELSIASVCQNCKATKKTNQSVQTSDITTDNICTDPVESGTSYETEVDDVVILTPSRLCRPKITAKEMFEQQTALKEDSQVKLPKNDVKGRTTIWKIRGHLKLCLANNLR